MADPREITIIKKSFLLSNAHLAEEINDYKILAARAGYDGNEVLTEITSKEDFEWWEREKDDSIRKFQEQG